MPFIITIEKKVTIKGHNYSITIEYGNLLKAKKCKRLISFDECFTTKIGNAPCKIKPNSLCGQYLKDNPVENMEQLISTVKLKPLEIKSKYQNKRCFESGRIVPRGNDLLLAFAKLNEEGLENLSKDEYLKSLSVLWKEIDKYYCQEDVCIPILGSGITRFENGKEYTQQELLDMIIYSYKLSSFKLKKPYKLRIICKHRDDFSLNDIGNGL